MSVKLAVFDLAGTTIEDDDAVVDALRNALASHGYKISSEALRPIMGYQKPAAIAMILEKLGASYDEDLINEIHDEFECAMLDHYEYSPTVRPLPGVEATMIELKERGIRIGLNTGFSKVITEAIINRLQWMDRGLVDDYIASDEVEEGRPQPFMIQSLMQRAGIEDPKEVIKIGDTEADVNEGINAGCLMTVAVTTGAFTRDQLEAYNPDYIISHLSELPGLIFDRD